MASVVSICNRALQHVGAGRIMSMEDASREARECAVAYDPVRRALLRRHRWNFAITRAVLAPDAASPEFDYTTQYTLPADCVRPILPKDSFVDRTVEGRKILTNDNGASLQLRYAKDVTDPNIFDSMFAEALALLLAVHICEPITQSNTKKQTLIQQFKEYIQDCFLADALERAPVEADDDPWIYARR